VDGFYNSINDFIYAKGLLSVFGGDSINNSLNAAGFGAAPVYKYVQGKARLYGGELSLDIHPSIVPWIEFNSTASYTDGGLTGVPDSTKYLPFVPPVKITADLKFHIRRIGRGIQMHILNLECLIVSSRVNLPSNMQSTLHSIPHKRHMNMQQVRLQRPSTYYLMQGLAEICKVMDIRIVNFTSW